MASHEQVSKLIKELKQLDETYEKKVHEALSLFLKGVRRSLEALNQQTPDKQDLLPTLKYDIEKGIIEPNPKIDHPGVLSQLQFIQTDLLENLRPWMADIYGKEVIF